jgi:hypothetical protein
MTTLQFSVFLPWIAAQGIVGLIPVPGREESAVCSDDRLQSDIAAGSGAVLNVNCWPIRSDSQWANSRAMMSAGPPAAKPTVIRTACAG